MKNISNRNGRALEYSIIEYLKSDESNFKVTLSSQAQRDQKRDKSNYNKLPKGLKESYLRGAVIVHNWLEGIISSRGIFIDKITDNEAKKGDVTDIKISAASSNSVNLSIKHNHKALKHQRPSTTANWCGYEKGSLEDIQFRKQLNEILNAFLKLAKKDFPSAKLFKNLLKDDKEYINNNLYYPVCVLVKNTINKLCIAENNVAHLFNFLVGTKSYFKLIDYDDKVVIMDYTCVPPTNKCFANLKDKSYINLEFSNGWEISMRIHTASSRLGSSLKFDSQPIKLPKVKETIIQKT